MKKTISLALALVLALSLAACGKNGNTDSSADVPADANTLLTTVWDSYTDDEKFPAAGGDYEHSRGGRPRRCGHFRRRQSELYADPAGGGCLQDRRRRRSEPHDERQHLHLRRVPHHQQGRCGAPLRSDLRDAIQSKQWMCGFPDKLVIFTYDQYVVSLYGDEELVNTFRDKFTAAYSDSVVAYDEAIA